MKMGILPVVLLIALIGCSGIAMAEPLELVADATVTTVLKQHTDQRVTVKLRSGEELSGTVKAVHDKVTHLHALSGMEFFDAVIVNDEISAVVVRVRNR
jgi:hypothetical protein